ncbi:MAG: hypothetical protein ACI9DC_001510 [Gammaproteobacteria bacterium]|jgi:hypothetical protein
MRLRHLILALILSLSVANDAATFIVGGVANCYVAGDATVWPGFRTPRGALSNLRGRLA